MLYICSIAYFVKVLFLNAYLIIRGKQVQGYGSMSLSLGIHIKNVRKEV